VAEPAHVFIRYLAENQAFADDDPVHERTRRAALFRLAQPGGANAQAVWWTPDMDVAAVLLDLYGRVPHLAREAVEGLDPVQLVERPAPDANPIGWLVWHLARVQDQQFADLLGTDQRWETGDWAGRFGLTPDASDNGYGHSSEQVAAVRPDGPGALVDYLAAVHDQTCSYLAGLTADDLDRVIDANWDPPVTLGVRLVSVADDCLQHAGQAAYLRGLLGDPPG
jgi:hypothetical protein